MPGDDKQQAPVARTAAGNFHFNSLVVDSQPATIRATIHVVGTPRDLPVENARVRLFDGVGAAFEDSTTGTGVVVFPAVAPGVIIVEVLPSAQGTANPIVVSHQTSFEETISLSPSRQGCSSEHSIKIDHALAKSVAAVTGVLDVAGKLHAPRVEDALWLAFRSRGDAADISRIQTALRKVKDGLPSVEIQCEANGNFPCVVPFGDKFPIATTALIGSNITLCVAQFPEPSAAPLVGST